MVDDVEPCRGHLNQLAALHSLEQRPIDSVHLPLIADNEVGVDAGISHRFGRGWIGREPNLKLKSTLK
jgi:hypothetical protein